jgi:hypothetical protein
MSKKLNFFFLSIILCIVLACSAGCAGYSIVKQSDQPTYIPPTDTPTPVIIKTPIPVDVVTPKPGQTLVSREYNNPSWDVYTSVEDQFTVQSPSAWKVKTITWSDANSLNSGIYKRSSYLDKIVFHYSPDLNGFVIIYGAYSYANLPEAGGFKFIPDTTYNEYVTATVNGYTSESSYSNVRYTRDDKLYLINGNPARALTIYANLNGQLLTTEVYFIDTDSKHYIVAYGYNEDIYSSYISTGKSVMNSFKPY